MSVEPSKTHATRTPAQTSLPDISLKVTVVGDPLTDAQKDMFLRTFTAPQILDDILYRKQHFIGAQRINLEFFMAMLRKEQAIKNIDLVKAQREHDYVFTRVFILAFDCDKPDTLENIEKKWLPEIQEYQSSNGRTLSAIVLVGFQNAAINNPAKTQKIQALVEALNIPAVIFCELHKPASIHRLLDSVVTAGLNIRNDKALPYCANYLAEQDFISGALAFSQIPAEKLSLDIVKLILFSVAKSLKFPRSDDNIKATIDAIVRYVRSEPGSRVWNQPYNRLTLFRKNPSLDIQPKAKLTTPNPTPNPNPNQKGCNIL